MLHLNTSVYSDILSYASFLQSFPVILTLLQSFFSLIRFKMLISKLITVITLGLVEATPLEQLISRAGYVVKESVRLPRDWQHVGEASGEKEIVFSIGLKQSAFDELEKQLYEGSCKILSLEIS